MTNPHPTLADTGSPPSRDKPVSLDELAAIFALESVKGFGPQKFKEVYLAGVPPVEALEDPSRIPLGGKRGDQLKTAIGGVATGGFDRFYERAERQLERATELQAHVIVYGDPAYPANLFESNYPVPVLYVRGSLEAACERRAVACVGSRLIRPPYTELQTRFARLAVGEGFSVVSGFATGADRWAHEAAWHAGGKTVAVMPSGLDLPFPPENRDLWRALLDYDKAAFVSEFSFATKAAALTLRKRNKMIVAFALGVLVGQSSVKGGAMNAYRFSLEQRKPVATFATDGQADTSGNAAISAPGQRAGTALPMGVGFEDASRRWLAALSSSI
jgi:DNA processing protein